MKTSEAAARRDEGMTLAVEKADRDMEGWSEEAHQSLQFFATEMGRGHRFLTEDVRAYAEFKLLVVRPENERAWGAVMRRAAALGMIKKVGYAPAKSSNLSPKVQWEVL